MYAGFALFTVSTALLLGSWFGLVASAALVALVSVRATLEERVLRAELEGYEAYARRVRYRLIPYLW
jgi:protein-S-isoprenylcysteine O-methyltransferase Ste14